MLIDSHQQFPEILWKKNKHTCIHKNLIEIIKKNQGENVVYYYIKQVI
jgi:hypothetical protein